MMIEPVAIKVDPEGELGQALREWGSAVVLDVEGVRFRVSRDRVLNDLEEVVDVLPYDPKDPDPLLRIIGTLDTGEPTDIARYKDQYIADSILRQSD